MISHRAKIPMKDMNDLLLQNHCFNLAKSIFVLRFISWMACFLLMLALPRLLHQTGWIIIFSPITFGVLGLWGMFVINLNSVLPIKIYAYVMYLVYVAIVSAEHVWYILDKWDYLRQECGGNEYCITSNDYDSCSLWIFWFIHLIFIQASFIVLLKLVHNLGDFQKCLDLIEARKDIANVGQPMTVSSEDVELKTDDVKDENNANADSAPHPQPNNPHAGVAQV